MIQVYADNDLVYDSRLDEYRLLALSYTAGVSISGTATIKMPPHHPAFSRFVSYRTMVTIYRDGVVLFRGRALTPSDDFYNNRTITCEGERGFFLDSVIEPYLYQDSPANIFAALLAEHNAQVDTFKRFKLGTVTVTDANEYVRLESESAEQTGSVLDKLVERCGGYILFETNAQNERIVNWHAEIGRSNNQRLEFGENLTDFVRTDSAEQPITRIYPYGAADDNGKRLTIADVNNGIRYIEDAEAVALRGVIGAAVYWDDVTEATNLLRKAQERLGEQRNIITSLQLSGVDLSLLDKSLDMFLPADRVEVVSPPHNLDEAFILMEKTEDLLSTTVGSIVLGKEKKSLIGLGVAADKKSASQLQRITTQIRADYIANVTNAISSSEERMANLIEQTSNGIRTEVSKTYTTNDKLEKYVETELKQTEKAFELTFTELQKNIDGHITEQKGYIRAEDGNVYIGKQAEGTMLLTLENDLIVFKKNGKTFGWWDGVDFHTGNIVVEVNERAQFGRFAFVPRSNGSLSFLKVSD